MTAILDTSFLFALTDRSDRNHTRVSTFAQSFSEPLFLPTVVLPEVGHLISSRIGHLAMRRFLQNLATSDIQMKPLSLMELQRINELLE